MPGKHRFRSAAATLVTGLGSLLWLVGPAPAAEFPVPEAPPFHLTLPAPDYHGPEFVVHAWPFGQEPSPKLMDLWAIIEENAGYEGGVVVTFANVSSTSEHFGHHGDFYKHKYKHEYKYHPGEATPVPLPSSVWLFLAALALLFGMSRRYISENR